MTAGLKLMACMLHPHTEQQPLLQPLAASTTTGAAFSCSHQVRRNIIQLALVQADERSHSQRG
jgi:hypothetical protein